MKSVKRSRLLATGLLGLLLPRTAAAQDNAPAPTPPLPGPSAPPPALAAPVAPAAADASAARTAPPACQSVAGERCPLTVVLVRKGWVVVEADRPLVEGERFILISQRPVRSIDPATGEESLVPEGEPTGMLVIERTRGLQGAGRLVRNAYAEVGDLAVPTSERYHESLAGGRRFPRSGRVVVDLLLGPLFGNTTYLGLLGTAAVEYRFAAPLKLAVELGPGALGGDYQQSLSFQGGVRGVLGLALSSFELSVGAGVQGDSNAGPGLVLSLGTRIGSLDGVNLTATSTFLAPVAGRTNIFDSLYGSFNMPVHRRLTLALSGGGGSGGMVWGYTTIDFRAYLTGTGGPGTWILHTGIGGYGVARSYQYCYNGGGPDQTCYPTTTSSAGPTFRLGFDTRF